MRFTLGTAAKAVGIAKSTMSRAVKNGRVSAERQDDGSYLIEASELYRVFGPQLAEQPSIERSTTQIATPSNGAEHQFERERALLLDQIRDLRERLTESERERRAIDEERRAAQRTIAALIESRIVPAVPDSASPAPEVVRRRRWWMFGR